MKQKIVGQHINPDVALIFLGVATMSYVPSPEAGTGLLLIGSAWATGAAIYQRQNRELVQDSGSVGFLLACTLASLIVGLVADNPITSVLKNSIPFLVFCWASVVLVQRVGTARSFIWLLIGSSAIWSTRLLIEGANEFLFAEGYKWLRLTLVNADAVVPFPLVIIPLLLFGPTYISRYISAPLLVAQYIIVLWTGYRSQQLLIASITVIYLFQRIAQSKNPVRAAAVVLGTAFVLIGSAVQFIDEVPLVAGQLERYSLIAGEASESGRSLERMFAWSAFQRQPLLGAGFGFQVPASITYASTEISEDYELPTSVAYLHNVLFYLLMVGGVPLLAAYLNIWIRGALKARHLWVVLSVMSLFIFIQVEATFLQIQFNLIAVLLLQYSKLSRLEQHLKA